MCLFPANVAIANRVFNCPVFDCSIIEQFLINAEDDIEIQIIFIK